MKKLVLDTCILIDYLRDKPAAVAYIEGLENQPMISAMTLAELYAGVRPGSESTMLAHLALSWDVLPMTPQIAERGGLYRRDYSKSHGVGLIDGLIAATAEMAQASLVTLNIKHFPMIKSLIKPY